MKKVLRTVWYLLPIIITIYLLFFKNELDTIDKMFILVNISLYVIPDIQLKLKIKK
jgi:choline-glycine betaine transporter